jgi:glycosyltransferase involved in cell wall biosynthesis
MKIAIDARFVVHPRRGIGKYAQMLVRHLAEIDAENEYILYVDREDVEQALPRKANFAVKRLAPANYLLWEQIALPLQARKDAVEILHCTGNTAPLFLDRRIRLISTIHDVMYLKDYSEVPRSASWYQRAGRFYRKVVVPRTAGNLSMVLTVSEFSRRDIMNHIPDLDGGKIRAIHEAANDRFVRLDKASALEKVRQRYGVEGRYILTLGALDPRKNTELVIREYITLRRSNKIDEKLVIVGIPNWENTRFNGIAQQSPYRKDILFTDFVSEEDLVFLYNGATLFLYPSSYEGFGIPPLEAMACGVPVITSNTTSIPEIVGDAAVLINPNNGEELRAALQGLLVDESRRQTLSVRGLEQAKKYSWRGMAEETLEVYRSVYRHGGRG